jgi:hypothetical protein
MAISIVAMASLVIAVIPTIGGLNPQPTVHDEFAYLLEGDTFAHGRLTNPPHAMWQALETFGEIQQPTYQAKFPPGQGIALALGQVIWKPILGVWLSVAAGCAAITWLMLAFFDWRWALLGGLLTAISHGAFWFSQTFWGGGVGMIGGALLAGAAVRLVRKPTVAIGIIAAIGVSVLAISRPFEGLIYTALIWLLALPSLWRSREFWKRVVPAMALLMVGVFAWMGYYNWRVTGSALEMPYVLYQKQYGVAPLMYWQKPSPPPTYRHAVMQNFYQQEWDEYQRQMSWRGFFREGARKLYHLAKGYVQPPVMIIGMLVGCFMIFRSTAARWSVIMWIGVPVIVMFCTPWMWPPYMAMLMGFRDLLLLVGLWTMWQRRTKFLPLGKWLVVCFVIAYVIVAIREDAAYARTVPNLFGSQRARQIAEWSKQPGKILVIVRYSPAHDPLLEEVYNDADIDDSKIVLARDMGSDGNRKLIDYFHDRTVLYWDVVDR